MSPPANADSIARIVRCRTHAPGLSMPAGVWRRPQHGGMLRVMSNPSSLHGNLRAILYDKTGHRLSALAWGLLLFMAFVVAAVFYLDWWLVKNLLVAPINAAYMIFLILCGLALFVAACALPIFAVGYILKVRQPQIEQLDEQSRIPSKTAPDPTVEPDRNKGKIQDLEASSPRSAAMPSPDSTPSLSAPKQHSASA